MKTPIVQELRRAGQLRPDLRDVAHPYGLTAIVNARAADELWLSVTRAVNANVPAFVGGPVMLALRLRLVPGGSAPEAIDQR